MISSSQHGHSIEFGFDEDIRMGEDFNFVKKANKEGKFRIMNDSPLDLDIRRLESEGRFNLLQKYVRGYFHRIFLGEMKHAPFDYVLQGDVNVGDNK